MHLQINFLKIFSILIIILLSSSLSSSSSSSQSLGNLLDAEDCLDQCQTNEYCHKGVCVDSAFLNLVLRSEEISEHNAPIDAPIRIHKYNLEEDTRDYDQDENDDDDDDDEEEDESSESYEDDKKNQEDLKKQIQKRIVEFWPKTDSNNYLKKRNINDEDDENDDESSEEDSNEKDDDSAEIDSQEESDEDNDDSEETKNIILDRINKRNIQLDDDDYSNENDYDDYEDYGEINKRSANFEDLNDEDQDESIIELKLNSDGTLNIKEIPVDKEQDEEEEQQVFQPIFAERNLHHLRPHNARFSDEDLARVDQLNRMTYEQARRPREETFIETLPPDSAYFYTSEDVKPSLGRDEDDYLEMPKRSDRQEATRRVQEESFVNDSNHDDEDNDSSNSAELLPTFANNPLERFLDSFVNANDASEQTESNENDDEDRRMQKRVRPDSSSSDSEKDEDDEQNASKPTEDEESSSSSKESTSQESNESDSTEQYISPAQKFHTARHPTLGLIDLITARWNRPWISGAVDLAPPQPSVLVEPIRQYNPVVQNLAPKRSQIWFREEKTIFKPDLSSQSIEESELKPFDRIKENLDQGQEKFIQILYDNQQQQEQQKESDMNGEQKQQQQPTKTDSPLVSDKDASFVYLVLNKKIERHEAEDLLSFISQLTAIDSSLIKDLNVKDNTLWFRLDGLDADKKGLESFLNEITNHEQQIKHAKGLQIVSSSLISDLNIDENNISTDHQKQVVESDLKAKKYFLITVTACASALAILITLLSVFVIKRRVYLRNKLIDELNLPKKKKFEDEECLVENETGSGGFKRFMSRLCSGKANKKANDDTQIHTQIHDTTPEKDTENILTRQTHQDYQELCRTDDFVPTHLMTTPVTTNTDTNRKTNAVESNRSSTSSWTEEPVNNIDIDVSTGHVILAYMENHLNDKNRILKEWDDLSCYEADSNMSEIGTKYMTKNRYSNILPYDHNRVKLQENRSESDDYINASYITDDEPKSPAYIATQGPLSHTTSDFWQMVWEQNSVMIISLCRTVEYGSSKCHQYWPTNGIQTYDIFEVNLVSEHVWCEDYLVRSFYLKNLSNGLSRTVTQFHFLTWPENDLPQNFKSILDFRRKLNRSYRKKSAPIIIHCNDGVGRTGTFILIDMILNKITMKGAKEIDLAATVEYLRDQRVDMLKTKNQFEFAFAVIADEVENMLKAQDGQ